MITIYSNNRFGEKSIIYSSCDLDNDGNFVDTLTITGRKEKVLGEKKFPILDITNVATISTKSKDKIKVNVDYLLKHYKSLVVSAINDINDMLCNVTEFYDSRGKEIDLITLDNIRSHPYIENTSSI